jgi:hypothetical protein
MAPLSTATGCRDALHKQQPRNNEAKNGRENQRSPAVAATLERNATNSFFTTFFVTASTSDEWLRVRAIRPSFHEKSNIVSSDLNYLPYFKLFTFSLQSHIKQYPVIQVKHSLINTTLTFDNKS